MYTAFPLHLTHEFENFVVDDWADNTKWYDVKLLVVDGTFGFEFAGFAVMVGAEVLKPPPPPVVLVESRYLLHKTSVLQPPLHLSPVTPAAAIAVVSTLDFDTIDGGGGGHHAVLLDG